MKKIFYLLLITAACFLVSCNKPEAPEYLGFRDFSIQNFSMNETLLRTNLAFYNPNGFNLQLKKGDVDVYLDDQLANHYAMDSTIDIPKKDTFYVPINLTVSPKLLLNSALKMLMNNNQIKVRLLGSVRVKRNGVAFTVPFDYVTMQKIE
jgi:LEA14-like dessication related protein